MIKEYVVLPGQTALDIALMLTGSIEGVKTIFENNSNVLDSNDLYGQIIKYKPAIIDGAVKGYFENKIIVTK